MSYYLSMVLLFKQGLLFNYGLLFKYGLLFNYGLLFKHGLLFKQGLLINLFFQPFQEKQQVPSIYQGNTGFSMFSVFSLISVDLHASTVDCFVCPLCT